MSQDTQEPGTSTLHCSRLLKATVDDHVDDHVTSQVQVIPSQHRPRTQLLKAETTTATNRRLKENILPECC